MIPWELLDEAPLPDGKGTLELRRRGEEFVIRVDGKDLMSSRVHGSEEALAELACARLNGEAPRILIGGLGMGFTLDAARRASPPGATFVVAELVPAVIEWNRGPLEALAGAPLSDERVEVRAVDVRELLQGSQQFDAVLLDVDNGPDALTRSTNDWLYERDGLRATFRTLRPGGVLGVWSAFDDPSFAKRLGAAGFQVETHRVRARGNKGSRHIVWLGVRPSGGGPKASS